LFVAIYGGFGGLDVARRPGFHFDNAEDVVIPPDQIEVATMIGRAVVPGDDCVASPAKVKVSSFLATSSGKLVRGQVLGRKRSCC
jgi:hypothetical protein